MWRVNRAPLKDPPKGVGAYWGGSDGPGGDSGVPGGGSGGSGGHWASSGTHSSGPYNTVADASTLQSQVLYLKVFSISVKPSV